MWRSVWLAGMAGALLLGCAAAPRAGGTPHATTSVMASAAWPTASAVGHHAAAPNGTSEARAQLSLQPPASGCVTSTIEPTRPFALHLLVDDERVLVTDGDGIWSASAQGTGWRRTLRGFADRPTLSRGGELWSTHASSMSTTISVFHSNDHGSSFENYDVGVLYHERIKPQVFVQSSGEPPLLLANGCTLYQARVENRKLLLERFDEVPAGACSDGTSAGGYLYLWGTEGDRVVTFLRREGALAGSPWQRWPGRLRPTCSSTMCISATGQLAAAPPGESTWRALEGETWLRQARECGGSTSEVELIPLGVAQRDDLLAIAFWSRGPAGRAVLVSNKYPTIAFPFARRAEPIPLAIDSSGGILALGAGLYRYRGRDWQRLGPP